MVSELILDLNVGVCSIWPRRRCLFVLSCNPMGHNEDVVFYLGGGGGGGGGGGCLSHLTSDRGETS